MAFASGNNQRCVSVLIFLVDICARYQTSLDFASGTGQRRMQQRHSERFLFRHCLLWLNCQLGFDCRRSLRALLTSAKISSPNQSNSHNANEPEHTFHDRIICATSGFLVIAKLAAVLPLLSLCVWSALALNSNSQT